MLFKTLELSIILLITIGYSNSAQIRTLKSSSSLNAEISSKFSYKNIILGNTNDDKHNLSMTEVEDLSERRRRMNRKRKDFGCEKRSFPNPCKPDRAGKFHYFLIS